MYIDLYVVAGVLELVQDDGGGGHARPLQQRHQVDHQRAAARNTRH